LASLRPEKNTISQNAKATMVFLRASKAAQLIKQERRAAAAAGEAVPNPTDAEIARYV